MKSQTLTFPFSFPVLESPRLLLRPFHLSDAKVVQKLAGHKLVAATTATVPHPYLDGVAENWINQHQAWYEAKTSIVFAITLKSTGDLIGCIDLLGISSRNLKAEIGYWVAVDYWNSGFCTEAMGAVVKFGFEVLGLNKITCRHMVHNPASGKVMVKNGLVREGTLRQEILNDGVFVDVEVYGILKSEYLKLSSTLA